MTNQTHPITEIEKKVLLQEALKRILFDEALYQKAMAEMKVYVENKGVNINGDEEYLTQKMNEAEDLMMLSYVPEEVRFNGMMAFSFIQRALKEKALADERFKFLFTKSEFEDVFKKDEMGQTAIHRAAIIGDIEGVNSLLNRGVDVNEKDKFGRTALSFAVSDLDPSEALIDLLIARGADLEAEDQMGRTPVFYAMHPNSLYQLALKGADFLHVDRNEKMPFDTFAYRVKEYEGDLRKWNQKCFEDLQLCLFYQPDLNKTGGKKKQSLLHRAAMWNEEWAMIRLIELGADINKKGYNDRTPIFELVDTKNSNLKMIWYFVTHGADLTLRDCYKCTPIERAQDKETVQLLLDLGADPFDLTSNYPHNLADVHLSFVKYSSGIVPYQATNLEIAEVLINDMQDKLKGVRKDPKKVLMPTRKGIRLIDQDRQKN